MTTMWKRWAAVVAIAFGLVWLASAQQSVSQNVPDAPSTTKEKTNPFPADAPKGAPSRPAPAPVESTDQPGNTRGAQNNDAPPSADDVTGRDRMFTIVINPTQVIVPVTIRDNDGRLVEGLTVRDFAVYEEGIRQPINFFTSDPFPLSVAVVVDLGMPDVTMKRVNESLPNIVGAFSQFDEVSLYTFGNSVAKVLDFSAV